MINNTRIIIIGAGAAGISAATRLLEKGYHNLTVLEAKDRIGGRIHTVEFSDNVIELGAQWVHGQRGNAVYNLAVSHNLIDSSRNLNDFNKYIFVTPNGEILPKGQSAEVLKIYYDISDLTNKDLTNTTGPYGEYVINEFQKILKEKPSIDKIHIEQFLGWIERFDSSLHSSDTWFDVSTKRLPEYWHCEGDSLLNWKDNGYKTLFDLLSKKIPDSKDMLPVIEKIEFNKEVSTIDYTTKNSITVKTKDGSKYVASHVIFTASLGVLKEKHNSIFKPSLPVKKQCAIKGLSIGTVNKIFLEFPHRWWQEDCGCFSLVWTKEDKKEFLEQHGQDMEWLCDVFQFFTVDYQPRVLCAWLVGKNARYAETLSYSEVFEGLYILLETFLGKSYNISRPVQILRSKWYTDDHFRGSYSFRSMTSEELNAQAKDLAEPILAANDKPLVLFAGEATHDNYYSTVHGAIETGFREANRLVEFYSIYSPTSTRTKLVIVGAGIAGLAAAKTLRNKNFEDFLLLEAQEHIGGRIYSLPWNNHWIEYGAQFLHGDKSKLAELCYQNQLLSNIECKDGDGVFLCDDGLEVNQQLVQDVDDFVCNILEKCENYESQDIYEESIGEVLKNHFKSYLQQSNDTIKVKAIKEEIFNWFIRFLVIDNSCFMLNDLSAKNWSKFKYVGGSEYILFKAGYNSVIKLLASNLNSQNLRLNTPVLSIKWQDNVNIDESDTSIVITLSDMSQIQADCIIITCSLGYLKDNYQNMFDPSLPFKWNLGIESLGFGLINKIFIDFGKPWWTSDCKGFQFLWKKHESDILFNKVLAVWTKDLTGFDVLQDHQGVLLGWVGGQGAYIIETLTEQQIAADCMNLLKYYLKFDEIPIIQRCMRTQWNANKYIKGSYSHIPVHCDKNDITPAILAKPIWGTITERKLIKVVPILMFAGEATHENYYSTTHGAYDTGVKQAQTFLCYHVTKD